MPRASEYLALAKSNPTTRAVLARSAMMTQRLVRTAELGFAAFTVSAVSARTTPEVFGVSTPLAAAGALYLLGAFGAGGDFSDDLYNFGDGCLAAYLTAQGYNVGARGRTRTSGVGQEEPGEVDYGTEELLRLAGMAA